MLFKADYDENGKKILCEMNGINSDMLMDIYVKKLKKDESLEILEENNECAVLLLSGDVNFNIANGKINEDCQRENPFQKTPYAVHFCKNTKAVITANEDSEILVQMTDNEKEWEPVFYNPDNCLYQEFGKGQWNGTGHRIVSTMFDLDNAPYSNMVMGEVFNQPGRWSSYPPHHHPQPELYYYQFDRPEGFGAGFEEDFRHLRHRQPQFQQLRGAGKDLFHRVVHGNFLVAHHQQDRRCHDDDERPGHPIKRHMAT